jgi:hypothetical protein
MKFTRSGACLPTDIQQSDMERMFDCLQPFIQGLKKHH